MSTASAISSTLHKELQRTAAVSAMQLIYRRGQAMKAGDIEKTLEKLYTESNDDQNSIWSNWWKESRNSKLYSITNLW